MLKTHLKIRNKGFSLIELMVGISIMGVLMAIALPNFRSMMRNTETRNAAESIQNGVQRARAEAVKRNTNVSFILAPDSSWIVTTNVLDPAATIESRSGREGSSHVTMTTFPIVANTVIFNSLGGVSNPLTQITQVDISAAGGDRNLRVVIGFGGSTKMCDPNLLAANTALGC